MTYLWSDAHTYEMLLLRDCIPITYLVSFHLFCSCVYLWHTYQMEIVISQLTHTRTHMHTHTHTYLWNVSFHSSKCMIIFMYWLYIYLFIFIIAFHRSNLISRKPARSRMASMWNMYAIVIIWHCHTIPHRWVMSSMWNMYDIVIIWHCHTIPHRWVMSCMWNMYDIFSNLKEPTHLCGIL